MANIVEWDAQEYVVRDKNVGWYIGMIVVGAVLIALSVWLKWWTFIVVVVVSIVALIVYSVRPPRTLHYKLDGKGLTEDGKMRKYSEYKSFGVLQEEGHCSIILIPHKRFSPRTTVFFPESSGEAIVDAFGTHLPMTEVKLDILDKIVKFLRI